jgi:glutamate 5-kinase
MPKDGMSRSVSGYYTEGDVCRLDAERETQLRAARRIVVKVGTTTVTGSQGELCTERVDPIAGSIARLMTAGRQVVLVSSGAIGLGRSLLQLHPSRLHDLVTKQACAAVGQSLLMDAYKSLFAKWDVKVAQVLLTEDDFSDWRRYSNLRHTIEKLFGFGVLPIVNENDTVSTRELESVAPRTQSKAFSDNDRLAALVMSGLEADALVLLTNVDGLLARSPSGADGRSNNDPLSEIIPLVTEVTGELKNLATGPSGSGRGGMVTKLEAAEIAMSCGGTAVIANGHNPNILDRVFAGERVGTAFLPSTRIRGKRRWIAYAAQVRGRVVVDAGAKQAITRGKGSLLTSGVVRIDGHFTPMEVISIVDRDGREFARGLANCASHDTEEVLRKKIPRVHKGKRGPASPVLVRRDNIVLLHKT